MYVKAGPSAARSPYCAAHDALDRLHLIVRPDPAALDVTCQHLDRRMAAILGNLIDRAAVDIGGRRVETRCKGAPDRCDIAGMSGRKHPKASHRRQAVDMGLERAPAAEAIIMGNLQLGLMQPGIGMAGAELDKPLLGGFTEPVKIGIDRQSLGHGNLLSLRPATAILGQERRKSQLSAGGGFDPLRGPSVACSTDSQVSSEKERSQASPCQASQPPTEQNVIRSFGASGPVPRHSVGFIDLIPAGA